VSFFNHKGGVGKTTVLFNVGVALAELGSRVVLFDVDSQANLTALAVDESVYEGMLDEGRTILGCSCSPGHGCGRLPGGRGVSIAAEPLACPRGYPALRV